MKDKQAPNLSRYLLVSLKTHKIQHKNTAEEVAAYMWGRDFAEWAIYQRVEPTSSDVNVLRTDLERREKPQS